MPFNCAMLNKFKRAFLLTWEKLVAKLKIKLSKLMLDQRKGSKHQGRQGAVANVGPIEQVRSLPSN